LEFPYQLTTKLLKPAGFEITSVADECVQEKDLGAARRREHMKIHCSQTREAERPTLRFIIFTAFPKRYLCEKLMVCWGEIQAPSCNKKLFYVMCMCVRVLKVQKNTPSTINQSRFRVTLNDLACATLPT